MERYETGIARCTMYGHFKFYHSYTLKNGGVVLYTCTTTNAPLFDKLTSESISRNTYDRICRQGAKNGARHEFNDKDAYRHWIRNFLTQAFR